MTISGSVSDVIERQSVVSMASSIPADMTIAQWRALRPRRKRTRAARLLATGPRVVPLRPITCDHLCETTTRYDQAGKRLTFLLACPVCDTVQVLETLDYEPRFDPATGGNEPPAGNALRVRRAA
jgi:hypothetical protein